MKKIAFVLAVLLFATPALATNVTIDACDIGGGQVEIRYVSDHNLPRAFGLDITVTDGNITACDANMTGECTTLVRGFGIFPGTIQIDQNGNITNPGNPAAPAGATGALGGIDTNGITIELGSLYQGPNEPALSGVLCTITVSKPCTVNIAGNAARCGSSSPAHGVVMEDWLEDPNVTYIPGVVEEWEVPCIPTDHPDHAEWMAMGQPPSWCIPRQCHGDADGLQEGVKVLVYVGYDDLGILLSGWQGSTVLAADFDHAEEGTKVMVRVGYNDLGILLANWQTNPLPDCQDVP